SRRRHTRFSGDWSSDVCSSDLLSQRESRRNLKALAQLTAVLAAIIGLFAMLFHLIMELEGQSHSWLTGLYWTLTVMTTLGFGDKIGRASGRERVEDYGAAHRLN